MINKGNNKRKSIMKIIKKNPTKYKIRKGKIWCGWNGDERITQNAYGDECDEGEMIDNFIFETTLEYIGYSTGRTSIDFYFKDSEGTRYIAKISKFDEMIQKGLFNNKKITATFTFYKIGGSYTIGLYKEK
ncbi:hypothetical protein KY334_02215 [Candidatus Woesearchaeota archaeon]|nr:hypothetical protein [Candidatus Woesearchaeota archaeon]